MAPHFIRRDFPEIDPNRLEHLRTSRAATSAAIAAALLLNIALIATVAAGVLLDRAAPSTDRIAASLD